MKKRKWEKSAKQYKNGKEDGIAQGIKQGIEQGIEQGMVETCKELGVSFEQTVARLKLRLGISEQEAQEKVRHYWWRTWIAEDIIGNKIKVIMGPVVIWQTMVTFLYEWRVLAWTNFTDWLLLLMIVYLTDIRIYVRITRRGKINAIYEL